MHENSPRFRKLHADERQAAPVSVSGARRSWAEAKKFLRSCGWVAADFDVSLRWSEAPVGTWVRVRVKRPAVPMVQYRWLRWSRGFDISTTEP